MLDVSTTVKRIAMALLGACLLMLGTPLLGVTPAKAGTASGPSQISLVNRDSTGYLQGFSTQDAAMSYFLVSATPPGPGYDAVASVQMTLQDTTANTAPRTMMTLTSAPWRLGINGQDGIPGNNQLITITARSINNVVMATFTINAIFKTMGRTAISIPSGNTIVADASNNLNLSGTGGTDAYATWYFLRDNSTGSLSYVGLNSALTRTATTWSVTTPNPTCPNTAPSGCNMIFIQQYGSHLPTGTPAAFGDDNEAAEYWIRPTGAAAQVASTVTLTPASSSVKAGAPQALMATVLDQNSAPMQSQAVTLTTTGSGGNTSTLAPASGTTDLYGQFQSSIKNNLGEITTVRAQVPGLTAATATFTTVGVATGVMTALPVKALNATPFTAPLAGTGSTAPVLTAQSPAKR